ncbi:LLM class flavin-dependent oxidoreductase [Amycolatopsis sp. lyj-112]|uniref:LLM class flavin-dependent oxidoreductase n=1 Tax=Amycolatopsis sp. lyj-112 TaxID=2789288 RepID=UPI00397E3F2B
MRTGVMILPESRWSESVKRWSRADELGFDSGWTYDHLWWRSLRDLPWFSAFPFLTAAACATQRIRLGTLVTSPNFRHPVVTAKDAITLDDVSGGRFTLGIGAGAADAGDGAVIGQKTLSARDRAARFAEFTELTDKLLRQPVTDFRGRFFTVNEARNTPGCVQRPRLPLAIAAAGPKTLDLAARYGDAWVTIGPTEWTKTLSMEDGLAVVARQFDELRRACDRAGRDVDEIDRIFVPTPLSGCDPLESVGSYLRIAEAFAAIGMTHVVIHWPRPEGIYAGSMDTLHRIAAEGLPQVAGL